MRTDMLFDETACRPPPFSPRRHVLMCARSPAISTFWNLPIARFLWKPY